MKILQKFFTIFTGFLVLSLLPLHAGELEDLSRELDYLEEHFWYAAALPTSNTMRSHFSRRLQFFKSNVSALYRKLHQQRIPNIPNLAMRSQELHDTFSELYSIKLFNRRAILKGTGMEEYRRTFLKNQRYYNKGKKRAQRPQYPTLRNINQTSYNMWVERICRENAQRLKQIAKGRKRGKKKYVSQHLRQRFDQYALAVAGLRAGFAALAQNPYYKEK